MSTRKVHKIFQTRKLLNIKNQGVPLHIDKYIVSYLDTI